MAVLPVTNMRGQLDDETGVLTIEIEYQNVDYSDPPTREPVYRSWRLELPGSAVEQT